MRTADRAGLYGDQDTDRRQTGGRAGPVPSAGGQRSGGDGMAVTREQVMAALAGVALPEGGSLVSADLVRALSIREGAVSFVIESPSAAAAKRARGCASRRAGTGP